MKTAASLLVWTAFGPALYAQITITNATFPVAGDTFHLVVDNNPGTIGSITPPGMQDWDFTGLKSDATQTLIYRLAWEGSAGSQLPEATLVSIPKAFTERYDKVTATTIEQVAWAGPDGYGLGLDAVFRYNPPLVDRRAPLQFFDIHASSSGVLEAFHPDDFPPSFIASLPFQADSFRIRIAVSFLDAVDAFGQMSIPGGTFEVLRVKRVVYTETRVDAKISPLGWLDVTDQVILYTGNTKLGVDTTATYTFLSHLSKEPIAHVTLDKNQAFATQIVYKNTDPLSASIPSSKAQPPSVRISPNPADLEARIQFLHLPPGNYQLVGYNAAGITAFRIPLTHTGGQQDYFLPSPLPAGLYMVVLYDREGQLVFRDKWVRI